MPVEKCSELVATNTGLLQQALSLLSTVDDVTFSTSPKALEPHRVGSHLRHVLEFYECFLEGLESAHIDYDSRRHDANIETNRNEATLKISSILRRIGEASALPRDLALTVRIEDGDPASCIRSSAGRELQALSSHTIHHFALIAVTLRLHGVQVDPDFGISPSTLRFQALKAKILSGTPA